MEKMVARVAISKVAGMASAKSSNTGRLVRMEVPQSPVLEILDVIEVLNRDRLIQSPFFRVGGDNCGVAHGRLPQVGRQRVTGDIMGNAEGNDGHTRQHDDHKQYSS